jgi:hypothetical protein
MKEEVSSRLHAASIWNGVLCSHRPHLTLVVACAYRGHAHRGVCWEA